jgi:hypothetical protein
MGSERVTLLLEAAGRGIWARPKIGSRGPCCYCHLTPYFVYKGHASLFVSVFVKQAFANDLSASAELLLATCWPVLRASEGDRQPLRSYLAPIKVPLHRSELWRYCRLLWCCSDYLLLKHLLMLSIELQSLLPLLLLPLLVLVLVLVLILMRWCWWQFGCRQCPVKT